MVDNDRPEANRANGGTRPVPDPTVLTTEQLLRAIAAERDFVVGQLAIRDERLAGIDEATKLRLTAVSGTSNEIDVKVGRLKDVHDEKFRSIETQFKERDIRAEREARDNKVAVDAAFAAQKEAAAKQDEANAKAIDKSEKATAETIKTNQELSRSVTDGLTKDVDSLKIAVNSIQSTKVGAVETRGQNQWTIERVIAIAAIVVAAYLALNR